MKLLVLSVGLLLAAISPAIAGIDVAPAPAPVPPTGVQPADMAAAISAQAALDSQTYAAQASIPPSCAAAPSSDTLSGTVGSGAPCVPRQDSTRPTSVQRANTTTDASGAFALTWGRAFVSPTPVVSVKPVLSAGTKGDCGFTTVSSTTVSGSCWSYQSVVVSVLGSTVSPIATAAAGIRVMLVGGEPTQ